MNRLAFLLIIASTVACGIEAPTKYPWTIVGNQGIVTTIYVGPQALDDYQFLGDLVSYITRAGNTSMVMFFDQMAATPSSLPMSDSEMLHWRARYSYNPNTRFEEFVFIKLINKEASPPKVAEIRALIGRR